MPKTFDSQYASGKGMTSTSISTATWVFNPPSPAGSLGSEPSRYSPTSSSSSCGGSKHASVSLGDRKAAAYSALSVNLHLVLPCDLKGVA